MSGDNAFAAVRREIEYAYSNVAFFRAHMEKCGLTPEDVRAPDDLARIRPTAKADYRRNYPFGVIARGYALNDPHVMRFQSSGTSGERLNSAILAYDLARRQATSMDVNRRFDTLWRPGQRPKICRYAPPNCSDVECATGLSTMEERIVDDGTLVLSVAHDLLATPEWLIRQAYDEIQAYAPDMLVVDPTHLAFLLRQGKAIGRRLETGKKLHIVCGYTLLTRVARRQLEAELGPDTPIADMLGMSELGYLGFECHEGRRHINDQDFYVEFVTGGEPTRPGEIGELVVTTIDDALVPRIRYATGDLYRPIDEPCPCGSALPVVRMEGRASSALRSPDGALLTPRAVDDAVGEAPFIDVYRLDQDKAGKCRFRFIANSADPEGEAALRERLETVLQGAPLEMKQVTYIACDRSGKFQSCASELSADPRS